jgi:hypothetical protein
MSQKMRILAGLALVVVLAGIILGLEYLRGRQDLPEGDQVTLTPGSVPLYLDGELVAAIVPDSLQSLETASFVDAEEGKPQTGWMLRDVLLVYLPAGSLTPETTITVISTSRDKSAVLTWAEVDAEGNMVLFDLSNRGTLKLVSLLERLDMRDEWVQDVDRIEVANP